MCDPIEMYELENIENDDTQNTLDVVVHLGPLSTQNTHLTEITVRSKTTTTTRKKKPDEQ